MIAVGRDRGIGDGDRGLEIAAAPGAPADAPGPAPGATRDWSTTEPGQHQWSHIALVLFFGQHQFCRGLFSKFREHYQGINNPDYWFIKAWPGSGTRASLPNIITSLI